MQNGNGVILGSAGPGGETFFPGQAAGGREGEAFSPGHAGGRGEEEDTFSPEQTGGLGTINEDERMYVEKRLKRAKDCLAANGIECHEFVPRIGLIGSGGGKRAMVAFLAALEEFGERNLLDAILYVSGVSGSTWCMASLYQNGRDWSSNQTAVTKEIADRLGGKKLSWAKCGERLKEYYKQTDHYNLTHFWSAIAVTTWIKDLDTSLLSKQTEVNCRVPYPIYTVIDKNCKQQLESDSKKGPWFELTAHEARYSLFGPHAQQEDFGSMFKNGSIVKKMPEMDMLYVQGMCGSALADGQLLWRLLKEGIQEWLPGQSRPSWRLALEMLVDINSLASEGKDYSRHVQRMNELLVGKLDKSRKRVILEPKSTKSELEHYTLVFCECFSDWYEKDRESGESDVVRVDAWNWAKILVSTVLCLKTWKWGTTYNFLHGRSIEDNTSVHAAVPSLLTTETRDYIDAGLLLNSPYFSVLREDRKVDLVISLDFSDGDPMMTVEEAKKMAMEMKIPFPDVPITSEDRSTPKDFYAFQGDHERPTVIHMPLFNKNNCGNKIEEWRERYKTIHQAYNSDMIEDLKQKSKENVEKNKDRLLDEIKKIMRLRQNQLRFTGLHM